MEKRKVQIILGNGFTMDLMNAIDRNDIKLSNLFAAGDSIPWPDNEIPGFLSKQNCPNLWNLGARPNMADFDAKKLIEDIITCVNVRALSSKAGSEIDNDESLYLKAYPELITYLKFLFLHYNESVNDSEIDTHRLGEWGWSKLFQLLNDDKNVVSVSIITYNYDIFLERVLDQQGIRYQINSITDGDEKFSIIKPHGSISFYPKNETSIQPFFIPKFRDIWSAKIDAIKAETDIALLKSTNKCAIIPPEGEADRYTSSWSATLREEAKKSCEMLGPTDDLFIGGISYGNVDRREIDELLGKIDNNVSVIIVNPDVYNTLNAVVSSIFKNFIYYTCSDYLGGYRI